MEAILLSLILMGGLTANNVDAAYLDMGVAAHDKAMDTPAVDFLDGPIGLVEFGYQSRSGVILSIEHMSAIENNDGFGLNYVSLKYRIK